MEYQDINPGKHTWSYNNSFIPGHFPSPGKTTNSNLAKSKKILLISHITELFWLGSFRLVSYYDFSLTDVSSNLGSLGMLTGSAMVLLLLLLLYVIVINTPGTQCIQQLNFVFKNDAFRSPPPKKKSKRISDVPK